MAELLIFIPLIAGFATNAICPVKDAGDSVSWRPPGWVFAVIWPILYILSGLAWYKAVQFSSTPEWPMLWFSLLILSLNAWLFAYGCAQDRVAGLVVLGVSIVLIFLTFTSIKNCTSCAWLLTPLALWLLFAFSISIAEIATV